MSAVNKPYQVGQDVPITDPEQLDKDLLREATSWGKRMIARTVVEPGRVKPSRYYFMDGGRPPSIVFVLLDKKFVVFNHEFRPGTLAYLSDGFIYESPGGVPKKGANENPEQVAKREVEEETARQVHRIVRLGDESVYWFNAAGECTPFYPFFGEAGAQTRKDLDEGEIIEAKVASLREWFRMIFSGQITDAKTIVVTMLSLPHMGWRGIFWLIVSLLERIWKR